MSINKSQLWVHRFNELNRKFRGKPLYGSFEQYLKGSQRLETTLGPFYNIPCDWEQMSNQCDEFATEEVFIGSGVAIYLCKKHLKEDYNSKFRR